MSTEYRRGIPSTAHVEAATRLGLEWEDNDTGGQHARWRFEMRDGDLFSDCALRCANYANWAAHLENDTSTNMRAASYRPIRPAGTPVDWEVLDQEVARVGQQGQPQGFRADLWRRIRSWITSTYLPNIASIAYINDFGIVGQTRGYSWDTLGLDTQTNEADRQALIARWTVYQELKPLYDLVDGAQGEAAMPRDVEAEWDRQVGVAEVQTDGDWSLYRNANGFFAQSPDGTTWFAGDRYGAPLRNFAAVLDAVAERRVAERMRGQTPANPDAVLTVTSAQPEPRRFADVRPDRHTHKHWRLFGRGCGSGVPLEVNAQGDRYRTRSQDSSGRALGQPTGWLDWLGIDHTWLTRTVIPTDEQGNPVSWESIGPTDPTEIRLTSAPGTPDRHGTRRAAPEGFFSTEPPTPPRPGQFSNNLATTPLTPETEQHGVPGIHITVGTGAKPSVPAQSIEAPAPTPSRFTLIEIDDADPTAEQIRQEQDAERQRLAQLRQRLAAERAAQLQETAKESAASRFDLIEPDPHADPAASIRAWEARQAAAKVRPMQSQQGPAAPRRPAIEVVDVEVDGLSRSEAFAALFGRALNGGC